MGGLIMSNRVMFSFKANYNSIYRNNIPNVLKTFNLKNNIKNGHQEAAELLSIAKELENNIKNVQTAATSSKGFSINLAG